MPLLDPPEQRKPKQNIGIRLEPELIEELDAYCRYIGAGRQHVIREALVYAFTNDAEYRKWRSADKSATAVALAKAQSA